MTATATDPPRAIAEPSVSVVLPTHNGARHLDQSIQSVVTQTYEDWELIVVNDASTDETAEKIEDWAARDERIRAVHLRENRTLPGALNEGFRRARGRYFTWTSDDNWYRPEALSRMLEVLQTDAEIDVVYADYTQVDERGSPLCESSVEPTSNLIFGNCIGPCFLYRRQVDEELGGYDENLFLAEDYDFWFRASLRFRFQPLRESLYSYRVHDRSLTAQHALAIERAGERVVERHMNELGKQQRSRVLVKWAARDFSRNDARLGRRHLLEAIWLGRRPLLYPGTRLLLVDLLFGPRIGRVARRLRMSARR